MALPRRRQNVAKHIKIRDLTWGTVAKAVEIEPVRFGNLLKGLTYPTPSELERIEAFFQLPGQILFDPEMLAYRDNWPPVYGASSR